MKNKKNYWKTKKQELLFLVQKQRFILGGFILMLFGNAVPSDWHIFRADIGQFFSNMGALLLITGLFELVFDEQARRELCHEIVKTLEGADDLQKAGLVSCVLNSKEVKEDAEWKDASLLIVGYMYSTRFLDDFTGLIKSRIEAKKKTVLLQIGKEVHLRSYLEYIDSRAPNIQQRVDETNKFILREFNNSPFLIIKELNTLLRYSFIYCDKSVWIKLYTNSLGNAHVPAFKIDPNTPLGSFIKDDMRRLGVFDD